jgi:hypothetical protein
MGSVMLTYGNVVDSTRPNWVEDPHCKYLRINSTPINTTLLRQPNYDSTRPHLDDLDRDIGFDLTPVGACGSPRVVNVSVSSPSEC